MEQAKPRKDGLALGKIGSLSDMMNINKNTNIVMSLDLRLISEDPNNPRTRYDRDKLMEMTESIKERGIISPISVRDNPEKKGHYIINHGHRRYRASKIARKQHIPAILDNNFQNIDQMIENIQRDDLPMMDIANFIGREMAYGAKQREIARRLGKSETYISHHTKLLDVSETISKAITEGRIVDVTAAYELVNLEKKHPEAVRDYIVTEPQITRPGVAALKRSLNGDTPREVKSKKPAPMATAINPPNLDPEDDDALEAAAAASEEIAATSPASEDQEPTVKSDCVVEPATGEPKPERMGKPLFTAIKGQHRVFLLPHLKPKSPKHVWVRYEAEHRGVTQVPIGSIKLLELNDSNEK